VKNAEAVHFADSIAACRLISKAVVVGQPVFDLSGGTGFPGLAFAILFPKHKVVILDRDTKKFEFPKHVTSVLGLSNVSFEAKSLDDLAPGSVWNLVSRSNAPLMKAMLGARKVVAQGGRFFHVKSDSWATELSSVPSQLFSFWSPSLIGQYRVPDTSLDFSVVQTEKIAE
jgi:16S rRNA (guanine527-N7)-methyltransferase